MLSPNLFETAATLKAHTERKVLIKPRLAGTGLFVTLFGLGWRVEERLPPGTSLNSPRCQPEREPPRHPTLRKIHTRAEILPDYYRRSPQRW